MELQEFSERLLDDSRIATLLASKVREDCQRDIAEKHRKKKGKDINKLGYLELFKYIDGILMDIEEDEKMINENERIAKSLEQIADSLTRLAACVSVLPACEHRSQEEHELNISGHVRTDEELY